jgi:hypothetical protein
MDPNSDNYDANATDQTPDAVSYDTVVTSVLADTDNGLGDNWGDGCSWYNSNTWGCGYTSWYSATAFDAQEMCTGCGGGAMSSDTTYNTISTPHCFRNGCMDSDMDNYDALATIDDGSCFRNGCMDSNMDNYDDLATDDDGSCFRNGCTNPDSDNYDALATVDDGSCFREGCMSEWADNYDALATQPVTELVDNDNGATDSYGDGCSAYSSYPWWCNGYDDDDFISGEMCTACGGGLAVEAANGGCVLAGCMSEWAENYDANATTDDGSCILGGCMEDWADNYNSNATYQPADQATDTDNGATDSYGDGCSAYSSYPWWCNGYDDDDFISGEMCTACGGGEVVIVCQLAGCTSDWADNYNSLATSDDGSCELAGCMSEWADNFNSLATSDDGSCTREGCMSDWADNFDSLANVEPSGVMVDNDNGATDPYGDGCSAYANFPSWCGGYDDDDFISNEMCTACGGGVSVPVCQLAGCMSDWADNYDVNATSDDGSCALAACSDMNAVNYDANATSDDGSCQYLGCTSDWADNFDPAANVDDGSCLREGCTSDWADNYDVLANMDNGSCSLSACTDALSDNFDANATVDDGSCYRLGCTSDWATNYDPIATDDDGTCYKVGCTASWADNFDSDATIDNGSCYRMGCTYSLMINFDPLATDDDGSCSSNPDFLADTVSAWNDALTSLQSSYDSDVADYQSQLDAMESSYEQLLAETLAACSADSAALASNADQVLQSVVDSMSTLLNDVEVFIESTVGIELDDITGVYTGVSTAWASMTAESANISAENEMLLANIDSLSGVIDVMLDQYQVQVASNSLLMDSLAISDPSVYGQIPLNLVEGWNMIGYNLVYPTDAVAQFMDIESNINIVKNNEGEVYWPEFGFNAIGDLVPGQGYQVNMSGDASFMFLPTDLRIDISPTVPNWAYEMETMIHPNDIRTLVRVVNMLGQEVDPRDVPSGTTLMYLYNDATVEKKIKR